MGAIVETRYGKVEGLERNGYRVFRGIPYAAPPVGPRRWLPPAPPEPWSGVRDATQFPHVAPQPPRVPDSPLAMLGTELGPEDEDCLYLNVFTPAADGARRPVLVWIHGGAFVSGTGITPLYDGRHFARRGDVVVVTINYRLGALGFLNLKEVTGGRIPATGCEGLLDQVAALEWVRDNIAAFGGDPDQVTIFGESAGGMSVGSLLGLESARGLFRRAIPQSGASSTAHDLPRAVRVAELLLEDLGIDPQDADSLRSCEAHRLVEVGQALSLSGNREVGGMIFQPVIDGDVLPRLPLESVRRGSADGVDVLAGSTLDEWKLFSIMDPNSLSLDEVHLRKRLEHGPAEGDLLPMIDAYRGARGERGEDTSARALFEAIQTDRIFRLPALRLAEAVSARGGRAYTYLFTWPSPALRGALGACHAIEIAFVFRTHDLSEGTGMFFGTGPAADALAETTQDAWLAFAKGGDPTTSALGSWPAYSEQRRATMVLGEKSALEEDPYASERRAWDGLEDGRTIGRL